MVTLGPSPLRKPENPSSSSATATDHSYGIRTCHRRFHLYCRCPGQGIPGDHTVAQSDSCLSSPILVQLRSISQCLTDLFPQRIHHFPLYHGIIGRILQILGLSAPGMRKVGPFMLDNGIFRLVYPLPLRTALLARSHRIRPRIPLLLKVHLQMMQAGTHHLLTAHDQHFLPFPHNSGINRYRVTQAEHEHICHCFLNDPAGFLVHHLMVHRTGARRCPAEGME